MNKKTESASLAIPHNKQGAMAIRNFICVSLTGF